MAVDLGERLLALHMADDENRSKLRSLVENMSRKFQSHAYPVSRTEALGIGLPVNKERYPVLEKLMWDVWLEIEKDLKECVPFDPLFELLNSSEASKLLAPVPQLELPACASTGANFQATLDEVTTKVKSLIQPIDFEYVNAIVESSRTAYSHVTRGKILGCRNPDLVIQCNVVAMSRAWEKEKSAKGAAQ